MKEIFKINQQYFEVTTHEDVITQIQFVKKSKTTLKLSKTGQLLKSQLSEYFHGKRTSFDLPLKEHYPFKHQKLFQKLLGQINYAHTKTYGEIAKELGDKNLSRVVGFLCNKNPFPIVYPCHRIVAANGIGGFAYGSEAKVELLELEKRFLKTA